MKKSSTPPPARPTSGIWRTLAVLSLIGNLGLLIWVLSKAATPPAPATPPTVARPRELEPYAALGSYMAENNRIADLHWKTEQFNAFLDGFRASYEGRGLPMDDAAKRLGKDVSARVQAMLTAERPDPLLDYFRTLREKENVKATASGLHYRVTEEGVDNSPTAGDTVIISYTASLPDGQSLAKLSQVRIRVKIQDLLPGLAEGVQLLKVGGKALVYVPPQLSFPEKSWPAQLPKGAPIVFFLELHDIVKAP